MTAVQDTIACVPQNKHVLFCERLAFDLTVANRAIWSDDSLTVDEQLNGLKWSNELLHRLWKIIWDLRRGEVEAFDRLIEHCSFYIQQAPELGRVLPGTLKLTLKYALEKTEE